MQKKSLENLFQRQFLIGCDSVNCNNVHCRSCNDFKHIRLSRAELIEMSRYYAATPKLHKFLCPNLPVIVTKPELKKKLEEFNNWAKEFIKQKEDSEIDFLNAIIKINDISDLFPYILMSNDKPLSEFNPAIDEDLVFDFANKLSSHTEVNAAVTALVFSNTENLNSDLNSYSSIRCLSILFAFPQIYHISVVDEVLTRLLTILSNLNPLPKRIAQSYFRKNKKLLSNAVSACHLLISHYFAGNTEYDPHIGPILDICRGLETLYYSNFDTETPLPTSIFYDYNINQKIVIDNELKMDVKQSFIQFPFVLSLVTKYALCRAQSVEILKSLTMSTGVSLDPFYTIKIRKDHLLEDAKKQIMQQNPHTYLRMIKVVFEGETEVDVGGPSREFFHLLSDKLFSPEFGLFSPCKDGEFLWFNPNSDLQMFQLAGTVVALAIYNAIVLPFQFPLVLYKKLQNPNANLGIHDFSQIDPVEARSILSMVMMRARGQDIMQLDMTFDITVEENGEVTTFPLKKGQVDLTVTNNNLDEFIQLFLNYKMNTLIKKQFDAFAKGFKLVCRAPIYAKLDPSELFILVSGEEAADWGDLRLNCEYRNGYNDDTEQITWFWDIFENDLSVSQKKSFLKFVTGSERVPLGGIQKLKIIIQKSESVNDPPSSKISINSFYLPCYQSKEEMKDKLKSLLK